MALTLDEIVDKQFQKVENGYDTNEVDDFLDKVLDEMESREKITKGLQKQVAELTEQLATLKDELEQAKQQAAEKPDESIPAVLNVQKQEESYVHEESEETASEQETVQIDKVTAFLEENKALLHKQLLDSLGLFEYEKEYATDITNGYYAAQHGYKSETVNGETRYYKNGGKIYPEITDEEYEALLRISKEKDSLEEKKEPLQLTIDADHSSADCFAASFLRGLSWFLWIGGLITSILVSRVQVQGRYYTETSFSWSTFFTWFLIYIVSGCLCYCMSDVASDIHIVASSITRFNAKERI